MGEPQHRFIPRLWNDLVPRGTLFTHMRVEGKVVHPNSTGSMRRIQLRRSEKLVGEFDLYDLLLAFHELLKEAPEVLLLNVQWNIATGNVKLFINQQTINDYYREHGLAALAVEIQKRTPISLPAAGTRSATTATTTRVCSTCRSEKNAS